MSKITIELSKYKNSKSSIFTGRPQGEEVRKILDLDELDKSENEVEFVIPDDTLSFNPSFYLGLLFPSYKKLKPEGFDLKYSFIVNSDNPDIVRVINKDLIDGKRNAINSLESPNSGFGSFFKSKK
ncbi:hypothetical protein [Flavobacterium sp. LB3R33]|uniref:hypothetical protein n=1 Tax=Flavobacterium sp. LB3R33 TaxID=3401721 RepID=UPI003AAF95D6